MCIRDRDKDEKNRVKNDLASLRRCLRKDKPEKMNENEEMCIRDRQETSSSCTWPSGCSTEAFSTSGT